MQNGVLLLQHKSLELPRIWQNSNFLKGLWSSKGGWNRKLPEVTSNLNFFVILLSLSCTVFCIESTGETLNAVDSLCLPFVALRDAERAAILHGWKSQNEEKIISFRCWYLWTFFQLLKRNLMFSFDAQAVSPLLLKNGFGGMECPDHVEVLTASLQTVCWIGLDGDRVKMHVVNDVI